MLISPRSVAHPADQLHHTPDKRIHTSGYRAKLSYTQNPRRVLAHYRRLTCLRVYFEDDASIMNCSFDKSLLTRPDAIYRSQGERTPVYVDSDVSESLLRTVGHKASRSIRGHQPPIHPHQDDINRLQRQHSNPKLFRLPHWRT